MKEAVVCDHIKYVHTLQPDAKHVPYDIQLVLAFEPMPVRKSADVYFEMSCVTCDI